MIYMLSEAVPTRELQGLISERFTTKDGYPIKEEGDEMTFFVPPLPNQAFLLLHRQFLYTTNQAFDAGLCKYTISHEKFRDWHAYELSMWTGIVMVRDSALLVAYPVQGGTAIRHRVFLTRASTSTALVHIMDTAHFRRYEKQPGWEELGGLDKLPAYVRPPECLEPDKVKQFWDSGKSSVRTGP